MHLRAPYSDIRGFFCLQKRAIGYAKVRALMMLGMKSAHLCGKR